MTTKENFLRKLEEEALLQAELENHQLLPRKLDWITSFIGRHPWQVILVVSGCTSFLIEVWKYYL